MGCPRCGAALPDVAHFCHVCGLDERSGDSGRRHSFAVKPDEPVASFALISSIMPRGAGQRPQTYRLALTVALAVALVAALFGAMPIAVLVAAFAIPVVYVVYLYDVNLWEDEPLPVTALAFLLTGGLALVFTVLWTFLRGPVPLAPTGLDGTVGAAPRLGTFVLVALLVPVVGELIRQVGPVMLASRPRFDDLMDGLTFGVVSGVAYACFDTLVRHWDLLTGGLQDQNAGLWASLVFLEGFVKPLVMGSATGLACAEFSGLGRGYDGFTPRYVRAVVLAVLANIAYQAGTYLFSFAGSPTLGVLLGVLWGLLILGVLILRLRTVLHVGLMEAALERSARERGVGETGELAFCARCEMPLQEHAAFCTACGTAVRVQAKPERTGASEPALTGAGGAAGGVGPDGSVSRTPLAGPPPPTGDTTEVRARVEDEEGRA
ncbi:Membrane proteinase PrsW, cleaves anti-sigma factor RsiW, M82 family [Friedmanniella luteola]|uniref:Membrane proteinase PrsW, cleaves anti-sigma factor RsiW, M82 family n=1 Tax=Friedmanniella luteola TaxID=546871 RepID=A0A1H1PGA7_9ACTN|nr:zinc ribbon domain-containing protein [Friedmanniella luteola]SDS10110.1 Membrane proteinase PrsW, cleaves anti-sigma factor RsiW, M82 family [Friedmanniella luteola]